MSYRFEQEVQQLTIWTFFFVVLLAAWLGGLTVFDATGGLINLLLVYALISLALHFFMDERTA